MTTQLELMDTTRVLLEEIADSYFNRNGIALTYALALKSSDPTDWAKVNAAILERWSLSGLGYIKKRAWDLVDGKIKL